MPEGTNVSVSAKVRNLGPECIAVVAAICQQDAVRLQRAEHLGADRAVVRLSAGQLERDREAVAVDDRVDFGRKPAAGTAHAITSATFFSPLAAC